MELTIAANKTKGTSSAAVTPFKAKYEAKKPRDAETTLEVPLAILEVPQSFTVTFTNEDMPEEDGDHNRPLYISGCLCDVKISRMLVDEGLAVNILPFHILKLLGISTEDL
ncbi:hypothetical protein LIER_36968 [Lithospermum erythrorhizon]|uniref:Uncharacterized protein n=1 Tax=Lithospermum erythrorhizon TaxID=34254 RepID=A0AAV3PDE4_LITER